jgi:hypothetical protein
MPVSIEAHGLQDVNHRYYRYLLIGGVEADGENVHRFMSEGLEPKLRIYPQLFSSDAQFHAKKRVFVSFCDCFTPDTDYFRYLTISFT